MGQSVDEVIKLVSEIAGSYQISSIEPLLASCQTAITQDGINVAVVGRFKAGKSSFLNSFLGRDLLPVGVIPVTAVVTEMSYGSVEKASVYFLNGEVKEVDIDSIRLFIAENENPENAKQVLRVRVELPALERFKGLNFVDTPGLESALAHNTEASLKWLPNVGSVLLAISVDAPLSQHDLALLKNLYQYTPKISILLTKADLLNDIELNEMLTYLSEQLTCALGSTIEIFPYSVHKAYEELKARVEDSLINETLAKFQQHSSAIVRRKLETLLRECKGYLELALKSAEIVGAERQSIQSFIAGEKEALDEKKMQLRLITRHAMGGTRTSIASYLEAYQSELKGRLVGNLKTEFDKWVSSLRNALESFEKWLHDALSEELMTLSAKERAHFIALLENLKRQIFRILQSFRDQLSERAVVAFGVPLRTSEVEILIEEPRSPDIRIGRVFDHNWELLSAIAPMSLLKSLVKRHFTNKVPYMVEKNLSRLAAQWEESINSAMLQIDKEAERRLDELVHTVERLIASSNDDAARIRSDLESINSLLDKMCKEVTG